MARKRPETKMSKIARMLIEEYQPQSAEDIQEVIKDLLEIGRASCRERV